MKYQWKIDYFALKEMDSATAIRDQTFDPPQSEVEKTVSTLWESILLVPTIGRNDDFFTLGGDSLSAMQVINRLREFYNGSTRITDLLNQPRLKDFCQVVEKRQQDIPVVQEGSWVDLDVDSEKTYPLTSAQKGLWFLWKMDRFLTVKNFVLVTFVYLVFFALTKSSLVIVAFNLVGIEYLGNAMVRSLLGTGIVLWVFVDQLNQRKKANSLPV